MDMITLFRRAPQPATRNMREGGTGDGGRARVRPRQVHACMQASKHACTRVRAACPQVGPRPRPPLRPPGEARRGPRGALLPKRGK
eukprot:scaffold87_cov388-Prasinococcus_capsulatus_cf.AAC.2